MYGTSTSSGVYPRYARVPTTAAFVGAKIATPLLLCLCVIELSDVVFAVDSIPAVLGISTDPLVVYSSNIFAIMGLRALYTLVARAMDDEGSLG